MEISKCSFVTTTRSYSEIFDTRYKHESYFQFIHVDFARYHVIVHVDLNLELFEDQTHHSKENLIPDLPVDTFGAPGPCGPGSSCTSEALLVHIG